MRRGAFARCSLNPDQLVVLNRGLLPAPSAVMHKIYDAVKNGDFSFFAGTYIGEINGDDATLV